MLTSEKEMNISETEVPIRITILTNDAIQAEKAYGYMINSYVCFLALRFHNHESFWQKY